MKKMIILIHLFLIIFFAFSESSTIDNYYKLVRQNIDNGNLDKCNELIDKIIEIDKDFEDAFLIKGLINDFYNNIKQSNSELEKVINICNDKYKKTNDNLFLNKIAYSYLVLKDYNKAIDIYKNILSKKTENNWEFRYLDIAFSYALSNNLEDSFNNFNKLLELKDLNHDFFKLYYYILLNRLSKDTGINFSSNFNEIIYNKLFNYINNNLEESYFNENINSFSNSEKCIIWFFIGEKNIVENNSEKAKNYLNKCIDTKVITSWAYLLAKSELSIIKQ